MKPGKCPLTGRPRLESLRVAQPISGTVGSRFIRFPEAPEGHDMWRDTGERKATPDPVGGQNAPGVPEARTRHLARRVGSTQHDVLERSRKVVRVDLGTEHSTRGNRWEV